MLEVSATMHTEYHLHECFMKVTSSYQRAGLDCGLSVLLLSQEGCPSESCIIYGSAKRWTRNRSMIELTIAYACINHIFHQTSRMCLHQVPCRDMFGQVITSK
jgi:hypothetical protein